jgi:hypothetical protein
MEKFTEGRSGQGWTGATRSGRRAHLRSALHGECDGTGVRDGWNHAATSAAVRHAHSSRRDGAPGVHSHCHREAMSRGLAVRSRFCFPIHDRVQRGYLPQRTSPASATFVALPDADHHAGTGRVDVTFQRANRDLSTVVGSLISLRACPRSLRIAHPLLRPATVRTHEGGRIGNASPRLPGRQICV